MNASPHGSSPTWPQVLSTLLAGQDLSRGATGWAMGQILAGEASPARIAAFAVALRAKGESPAEINSLAETMLQFATRIEVAGPAVDIVGSGGDRANTVNVSSMAAIVAAAAGARVVKHGNRAASSACGAADLLEELGVVIDLDPRHQPAVVERVGIAFLFASLYHPALRHAGPVRRELGVPTMFNLLGPLTNPAQPGRQAVGLADPRMAELVASALSERGNAGMVFHGGDGLDELTTTTTSTVWCYDGDGVRRTQLDPADLGLPRADVGDLVGGDAATNAGVAREVFAGRTGPVRDIVLLNAAAALTALAGPQVDSLNDQLADGLTRAAEAVDSGAAAGLLDRWISVTRELRDSTDSA